MPIWLTILLGLLYGGFFGIMSSPSKDLFGKRLKWHLIYAGFFVAMGLIFYAIHPTYEVVRFQLLLYSPWFICRVVVIEAMARKK